MASPPLRRASSLTTADDITGAPGACALSGQFPIEPSHDSLHDTVTASNRLSFSRRSSLSKPHRCEDMCSEPALPISHVCPGFDEDHIDIDRGL